MSKGTGTSNNPPEMVKEWVELTDPDDPEWSYLVDMSFLLSGWGCIFGNGCHGTFNDSQFGCCGIGVMMDKDEAEQIEKRAELLGDHWQLRDFPRADRVVHKRSDRKEWNTLVVRRKKGEQRACVFANRADFHLGAGCAFHTHALAIGENPIDWKPKACWMQPMTTEADNARQVTILRMTNAEDWYGDRDDPGWSWWCGNEHGDAAWHHDTPVFKSHHEEIRRMLDNDIVFNKLIDECEKRWSRSRRKAPVPGWVPVTMSVRHGNE